MDVFVAACFSFTRTFPMGFDLDVPLNSARPTSPQKVIIIVQIKQLDHLKKEQYDIYYELMSYTS